MSKFIMNVVMILAIAAFAQIAVAECYISGSVDVEANAESGPAWVYTLSLSWDTGGQHGLSHANLLLDGIGGTCSCADFQDALSWSDPIGSSNGDSDCTVHYDGFLECSGDPSIPGVEGFLLKFEPDESDGCEPGPTGSAEFVFYSDLGPAPIDADILTMVEKDSNNSCFGSLTGYFPAMTCDPVSTEARGFGSIKGMYR